MRNLTEIIVHCTATRPEWMASNSIGEKINEIRRWHKARGWSDIGYHYVIGRDGKWSVARPLERIGAHVKGHNTGTIGISLVGGHGSSENDSFADNFTPEQDAALRDLIAYLKKEYPTIKKVSGHNQYAAKACPGFKVGRWLKNQGPRTIAESRTVQGSAVAVVGTTGTATVDMIKDTAADVSTVMQYAPTLQYVFVALTLAGTAFAIYARLSDRKAGRL